jgi:lambda family phage tail tape measure protein
MAANEKFILEFVTKGVQDIDKAKDKIDGVNRAVSGLATALLGVSFASFVSGALQAADRISDFSDATNISIASLKGLEAAMNSAGGNGRNLERSINQLFAAIESANGGSLAARDAFAKVGVSLNDLRNLSEADILQKTLQGLAQLPAGAERSAVASTLLSKAFRGIDPAQLLEALDPDKYLANEEATKKAAAAQQQLEQSYKTLQEGAIAALEPILKLMGEHTLTVENATKMIQGLGIAFAVVFGAQAVTGVLGMITAIVNFNKALAVTAGISSLLGKTPLGVLMKLGATIAGGVGIGVAIDELTKKNDELADSATKAGAAQVGALGATPASTPTTGGRIVQANPQAGAAGRNQELDARQRAVLESQKRISQSQAEIDKLTALQGASEVEKIQTESAAEISKARLEIYAKENLSKAQKDNEFSAKRKEIEGKAALDIARVRQEQENMVMQQKIGFQDQIGQLLGYEKTEVQKITEQIAQQPEKYKDIGDRLRENAALQDQNLKFIKDFNKEQERSKQLMAEGYASGVEFAKSRDQIALEEERITRLGKARNELEKTAINEDIDRRKRLGEVTAKLISDEKNRQALISDLEGDATGEQIQRLIDMQEQIRLQTELETELSNLRVESAARVKEQQDTFVFGWEEAFNKYVENAYNSSEQARNLFSTFTRGMEDSILNFVKTGKLSFKDLANTILEQIIRIQVQRASASLFGGQSGGGLLGGIFSGIGKIFGFANGGTPPINRPSLVGEQGPELFIPRAAGTIIPNGQTMAALAGGGGTSVTYNIQAVDAASFRNLVARDPQFLFQVTEKGRRSQPTRSR